MVQIGVQNSILLIVVQNQLKGRSKNLRKKKISFFGPGCVTILNRVVFPWGTGPPCHEALIPKLGSHAFCKTTRGKSSIRAPFTASPPFPFTPQNAGNEMCTHGPCLLRGMNSSYHAYLWGYCLSGVRTCSWCCRTKNHKKWIQTREHLKCQYYLHLPEAKHLLGLFSYYFTIRVSNWNASPDLAGHC